MDWLNDELILVSVLLNSPNININLLVFYLFQWSIFAFQSIRHSAIFFSTQYFGITLRCICYCNWMRLVRFQNRRRANKTFIRFEFEVKQTGEFSWTEHSASWLYLAETRDPRENSQLTRHAIRFLSYFSIIYFNMNFERFSVNF